MHLLRTAARRAVSRCGVGLLLVAAARPAAAQIDYRNLDDERPTATEDAYPIEHYAFELLVPYRFQAESDGSKIHSTVLEAGYGLFSNAQVGVHLPFAAVRNAGSTESGLAGIQPYALYNFNTEGRWLPALSLRGDIAFPIGSLGGDGTRFTIRGLATRTWGRTRFHLNAARSFGPERGLSVAEPARRWTYGFAADRTLFRQSVLLIGEIVTSRTVQGAPVEANVGVGFRWQWTPTLVLDAGITRRLRSVGPDLGLTIGLSHAFALRALMPSGSR